MTAGRSTRSWSWPDSTPTTDKPRHRAPQKAPEKIERLSADEAEFEDVLPEHVKNDPTPVIETTDDDFLKLIEDDVKKPKG